MGQVVMTTNHCGQQIVQTSGVGFLMGGRLMGSLEEGTMVAWIGCPLPRTQREVGKEREKGAEGARIPYSTTTQSIIHIYCTLQ